MLLHRPYDTHKILTYVLKHRLDIAVLVTNVFANQHRDLRSRLFWKSHVCSGTATSRNKNLLVNFDLKPILRILSTRTAIELLFPFPVYVVRLGSNLLVNGW